MKKCHYRRHDDMGGSKSSPSEENQVEYVMGASVMIEMLMRDTCQRQAAPHTDGTGASGTFSLARLSMTTLTALTSPLSVLVLDPAGSLPPCLSSNAA